MPLQPDDPNLNRIIAVSQGELERLSLQSKERLLAIYKRERDALIQRITAMASQDTWTVRHMQESLRILDETVKRLYVDLQQEYKGTLGEVGGMAGEGGIREVSDLERKYGSIANAKAIASLSGRIPHKAIALVEDLTDLEVKNLVLNFDGATKLVLQQQLLRGLNSRQMASELGRALAAAGDQATKKGWELERILRTGASAVQARAHNDTYTAIRNDILPDLKRAGHEFLMSNSAAARKSKQAGFKRVNHPFSFYVEGKVAELDQPWRVKSPEFPVMFWHREGGEYVGMHYPAHLNERGRQVPWRECWGQTFEERNRAVIANMKQKEIEGKLAKKAPAPEPEPKRQSVRPDAAGIRVKMKEVYDSHAEGINQAYVNLDKARWAARDAQELVDSRIAHLQTLDRNSQAWEDFRPLIKEAQAARDAAEKKYPRLQKAIDKATAARDRAVLESIMHPEEAQFRAVLADYPGIATMSKAAKEKATEGLKDFRRLVGPGHIPEDSHVIIREFPKGTKLDDQRAFYSENQRMVCISGRMSSKSTVVHEMGHFLEHRAGAIGKVEEFWKRRTADSPWERLEALFPGVGYKPNEWTKRDNFAHPYTGKAYFGRGTIAPNGYTFNRPGGDDDKMVSSEVVSMGLQHLYENPLYFAETDPDYFDFIWGIING